MAKRGKNSASKTPKKTLERQLVENLVELQKVHTNLAEKFDKLSSEISQLLSLFELTARSFAKHPAIQATEKDKEFLDKIDLLLNQNKTIARGLGLMEEKIRERMYGGPSQQITQAAQKPAEEYEPSISSNRPLPKF